MTDVSLCEYEVSLNQSTKRDRSSDDEGFENHLDYEYYDNIEESHKVERQILKRFKEHDDDQGSEKIRSKVAVFDLFGGESSDEDVMIIETCSTASVTSKKDSSEDEISSFHKALQKVLDIFNFDESKKCRGDSKKSEDEITDLGDKLCTTDIPERMQVRSIPVTSASEEELIVEAQWIYDQAFERKAISIQDSHMTAEAKKRAQKGPETVSKIVITLELMRNQHLEVPFIAFYRKEYILPELNINDLWKIYKYDAKWNQLSGRREALINLFQQMKPDRDNNNVSQQSRLIEKDDIEQLEETQTIEQLNDFYHLFLLHYGHEILKEEPADCDEAYSIYRKADLNSLAKRFGLSLKQFAKNLSEERQVFKIEKETAIPCVLALNYVNDKFDTPEEVLKAVQSMVAMQISREPLVRAAVRKLYVQKAKISVRPTKKGIEVIGENHPVFTMKYLKDKPVNDLVGDQYLKLAMAQDDQLITISFSDQVEGIDVERMKQLYCRNESDKHVQEWNLLRTGSVEAALTKLLIPDLKKELHSMLLAEAKEYVMRCCTRKMYNWIKTAPYRCTYPSNDQDWDTSKGVRVMGVAYVPDHSVAAFACMIGFNGECTDFLNLPNLLKMKNGSLDKATMDSVLTAVKNMIATKKPHVIAIGGESSEAMAFAQDFRGIIASLVAERRFPNINVEIVENEAAVAYSTSRKGVAEFPGYPVVLRQAISLARRLQDPLVEFSQLCNVDDEILSLKFHSLQNQLPTEYLRDNIYLEFVNRVNEVGVDVNKAVKLPYYDSLLQFVGGFGPSKAQYLLKTLRQADLQLKNRQQLTTSCHVGTKIFANCAGFIKINANNLSDETRVQVLDGSRVHPENYDWAGKIAADTLDYDTENTNLEFALRKILESPEKLQELDLDAYAKELDRQGFGNKCVTVYDIRSELTCRYKDLRKPYQSPTADQLFRIFAKETPEDFFVGKLVEATIVGVTTGVIRLRLDNGISGYISINNLSDERMANPEERIRVGSRIYCRIVQIDVDKFCVEASSKGSDLADKNNEWRLPKDKNYDSIAEAKDVLIDERARNMQQQQIDAKHSITHRCFRNINFMEAEKVMQTMQSGEVLIRPSSKGQGHLCLSWKVTDDVNQHIAVRDDGKSFWINDEKFRNFDEIITRHINPMAAYVSELLNFKYYKPQIMGMQATAEAVLKEQKWKNPKAIPYIISPFKNNPGKFMLSYLPNNQCCHNNISISPNGLKFGGYRFTHLNDLIHWFKEHSKCSIPEQITPITSRFYHTTLDINMKRIHPETATQNQPNSMLHSLT